MLLLLCVTAVALAVIYVMNIARRVNQHWEKLGVPHEKPLLFFGNVFDLVIRRKTRSEILRDIYNKFPSDPIVGYYHFLSPRILIRDMDLVERVLVKDFAHFIDRGPHPNNIMDNPLTINLFTLKGKTWKTIRAKFSPMFATSKLHYMLPRISGIGDELIKLLDRKNNEVDIRDKTGKFVMEVIGSCAFGVEPGPLGDEEIEFRTEANHVFNRSLYTYIRRTTFLTFPSLSRFLKLNYFPHRTVRYFSKVVRETLENRKRTNMQRNDFVQLMVSLQGKESIEIPKRDPNDDYLNLDYMEFDSDDDKIELTNELMVGQAFSFLFAGFEATVSAMAFMCMELAINLEAQEKARKEVLKVLGHGDEITFDKIKDLRYLDYCLKESLRLNPPIGQLMRMCVKEYTVPGTFLTLRHGDPITLPVLAIHTNPQIFSDPLEFIPERWNIENAIKLPPCSYLPFGEGPRMCIGMRFAIMKVKLVVAKILMRYRIKPHPSLKIPIKIDPYSFVRTPMKPMLVNLEKFPL